MSEDLQNQFGPSVIDGFKVTAFRYPQTDGGVHWSVTVCPNDQPSHSDYLVVGEVFYRSQSALNFNSTVTVTGLGVATDVSAEERGAVLKALKEWEAAYAESQRTAQG